MKYPIEFGMIFYTFKPNPEEGEKRMDIL